MMPTLGENAVVQALESWMEEQGAGVAAVSVDEAGHPRYNKTCTPRGVPTFLFAKKLTLGAARIHWPNRL